MPKLKFFPYCTEYASQYWSYPHCTDLSPLRVLMLSPNVLNTLHSTEAIPHCIDVIPHSTEGIPHMYCCYPPTALKVSLHSTESIPTVLKQHWRYPSTVLNTLHNTDVITTVLMLSPASTTLSLTVLNNLHSTESIPTVLKLSSNCTEQPQQYWSYPHSTEANPHSTEAIPTVLMLSPDVLNNLRSTEPMLYGVINWLGAGLVSFAKNRQHKIFPVNSSFDLTNHTEKCSWIFNGPCFVSAWALT